MLVEQPRQDLQGVTNQARATDIDSNARMTSYLSDWPKLSEIVRVLHDQIDYASVELKMWMKRRIPILRS